MSDGLRKVVTDRGGFLDTAVYSEDLHFRYLFERRWDDRDAAVWVLLNPATGDTDGKPRPTLGRCIARSREWGYGAVRIVNLFAYRATRPRDLLLAEHPVGPLGDEFLRTATREAACVVAAWGGHGRLLGRGRQVMAGLPRGTYCLGLTRDGQPRHPLYVPASEERRVLDPWKDDVMRWEVVES